MCPCWIKPSWYWTVDSLSGLLIAIMLLIHFVGKIGAQTANPLNVQDIVQQETVPVSPGTGQRSSQHLNWNWYTRTMSATTTSTPSDNLTGTSTSLVVSTPGTTLTGTASPAVILLPGTAATDTSVMSVAQTTTVVSPVSASFAVQSQGNTASSLPSSSPANGLSATTTETSNRNFTAVSLYTLILSPGTGATGQTVLATTQPSGTQAAISNRQTVRITRPMFEFGEESATSTSHPATATGPDIRRSVTLVPAFGPTPLLSMKVAVPSRENVSSPVFQQALQEKLSLLYILAEAHYELIAGNKSGSILTASNGSSSSSSNQGVFTAQLYDLSLSRDPSQPEDNMTVSFFVKEGDRIIPATDALQRLVLLSDAEFSDVLGTDVLQRPTISSQNFASDGGSLNEWTAASFNGAAFPWNGTVRNDTIVVKAVKSWSLIRAIVGVSTVAVVLLAMALVWLVLFLYGRYAKRPSKTAQAPVIMTDNHEIIRIPLPTSHAPISVDNSVQTIVLPRRTVAPSYASNVATQVYAQNNGYISRDEQLPGMGVHDDTMYTQYSYAGRPALPAHARLQKAVSPDESSMSIQSPPPPKPPRMINEPQYNGSPGHREVEKPWEGKNSSEIPSSTNSRIKLLSVVKTNRVDPWTTTIVNSSLIELQERPGRQHDERKPFEPKAAAFVRNGTATVRADRRSAQQPETEDRPRNREMTRRPDYSSDRESGPRDYLRPTDGRFPQTRGQSTSPHYEETVQEIRREVRLWRRSQNSYSPNRYSRGP